MRNIIIAEGEYYHVYNRGVRKQDIFLDDRDWVRFLFCILYFQSSEVIYNLNRLVSYFVRHSVFNIDDEDVADIVKYRYVELVAFCLMPNHFHLIVKEHKKGGIARYMQRVQNAYTKYFNTKYQKSGHLLQGPYKIVHVEDNEQLLYLSAYIHRNPLGLGDLARSKSVRHSVSNKSGKDKNEGFYAWSSYRDYLGENRFEGLLAPEVIMEQFEGEGGADAYREAVANSGTKERDPDFDASLLIDGE